MMTRRNFLFVAAALGAGALLGGCAGGEDDAAPTTGAPVGAPMEEDAMAGERTITVACGEAVVTYELNDSAASEGLLAQLPLALEVEDFSDNEKVFYPPEELDVTDAPLAETGEAGTLAYYAPWGDVVMFYGSFSPNGALYELGRAVDGMDAIAGLSGAIEVSSAGSATSASTVYFTRDISPEGLLSVWHALGATPSGNVAVKLSTGEPGGHNFLSPGLIADLIHEVGGTIVECNTAYGGQRGSTESHLRAAADHGFTAIADVDIMDADGSMSLPVTGGAHLTEDLVGAHLADYDYVLSLAHFKGHAMGGFGGAVKNCSIGIASREGKMLIHSAGASTTGWGSPAQDDFLESMAEAAKAVSDHFGGVGGNMAYVNVMNRLSVDCDCDSNPAEPDMADIGILASLDPVALDRACVDLVYAADDGASADFAPMFGKGAPNEAFAQYFIGNSYLNPLTSAAECGVGLANVTFEPGCRNNWHVHHADKGGGQILICTDGRGWYQEWGKEPQPLAPGDVVVIHAGVKHWHGAARDSWFSHIAFEAPGEGCTNEWLEPVADEDYPA